MGRERPFFYPPRGERSRCEPGGSETRTVGWGELYATLIAHGHRLDDVRRYTNRQLTLFYREAVRRDARMSTARLLDVNAGFAGGEPADRRVAALRAVEDER